MKIEVGENSEVILKEVYSSIVLETAEGNRLVLCMRDDTIEMKVLPKLGSEDLAVAITDEGWWRVDMKGRTVKEMT